MIKNFFIVASQPLFYFLLSSSIALALLILRKNLVYRIQYLDAYLKKYCQQDFNTKIPLTKQPEFRRIIDHINRLITYVKLHNAEMENSIRKRTELLNSIIYTVGGLVIVLDSKGRIFKFNKFCEEITGFKEEELAGNFIWDYINSARSRKDEEIFTEEERKEKEKLEDLMEILLNSILSSTFESELSSIDGRKLVIFWNNTSIKDEKGNIVWTIGTGIDITARVNAEQELKELNEELELKVSRRTQQLETANHDLTQAMEDLKVTQDELIKSERMAGLGELVAGVAHEINTPVGIAITATSHLSSNTRELVGKFNSEKMKKSDLTNFLETLEESCIMVYSNLERASELIRGFKEVAVDQTSEALREFDLNEYIQEILLSLRPQLKKTKHQVIIQCPEKLILNSYPGAFSQIFTNFIMNSLIHGFENKDDGIIQINVEKQDKQIKIVYQDNGKGIPKNQLKKIFDPFFTTKRGKGGTGLGLNVVYNLIYQKIGGTIDCESEKEKGTSFNIMIPIK
ncbi:MAG: ATP-binding protein [Spirochaetes bacterium]|nr:ATP-binding protein [Spirochaetota bacterium]